LKNEQTSGKPFSVVFILLVWCYSMIHRFKFKLTKCSFAW